jgi:hypothetical protein
MIKGANMGLVSVTFWCWVFALLKLQHQKATATKPYSICSIKLKQQHREMRE